MKSRTFYAFVGPSVFMMVLFGTVMGDDQFEVELPLAVVDIAKNEGLADGLQALDGGVSMHLACHARAQNMGQKAAELLRLIPEGDTDDGGLKVIERCSGHGGSWGIMKQNFDTAIKVGRPVARRAAEAGKSHVVSECPLAGAHIRQGMELLDGPAPESTP